MKFAHFFIDRPIFATVLSLLVVVLGAISYLGLPIALYPDVAPPTIQVSASYPGASAETVSKTVAAPIEQAVNGVENMLYMSSQSTGDGNMAITVTFALGTDLDTARVMVQNRVAIAEPRLPAAVRELGITTQESSPNLIMAINLLSPDKSLDQLFVSNHAVQIRDRLTRLDGVSDVLLFGAREYSIRVWLDPERMAALGLIVEDVIGALKEQNVQVAAGVVGQEPLADPVDLRLNIETRGRLRDPDEFERIIVKRGEDGSITRIRDIGRVEIGGDTYSTNSYLGADPAVAMALFQRPGSNALATADEAIATMEEMKKNFPPGLDYAIVYNPTEFIKQSIDKIIDTIFEATILTVVIIVLFLKTWRAAVIPIAAIPISLIGTFTVMAAMGYSLNTLSLLALVLAIGIVVDDAIVVVENIERNLRRGLQPREAARKAMSEVGGALVAISLVLLAVFGPVAFIPGITGQFFRQFAVAISASSAISLLVSLTLSPALAALLLKPEDLAKKPPLPLRPVRGFFNLFDRGFGALSSGYGGVVKRLVRLPLLVLAVYGGLIYLAVDRFRETPGGFVPAMDQGYYMVLIQALPGSSLSRTDAIMRRVSGGLRQIDGIAETVNFAGFNIATFTMAPDSAVIFAVLLPPEKRAARGLSARQVLGQMWGVASQEQEALVFVVQPPPIPGIGTGDAFKMYVLDQRNRGPEALAAVANQLVGAANQDPDLSQVFTLFNTRTPQVYADIDRHKAKILNVPLGRIFSALSTYLGSTYVNDINLFGRTFRVRVQADGAFRDDPSDLGKLWTRNLNGEMVPLSSVMTLENRTGPYRVPRYDLFPGAAVQGTEMPGVSTGEALTRMEALAQRILPDGFAYEWTELALQEKLAGNTAIYVFVAAAFFVFLLLAAQYESWLLPLSVILIVPMCLLAAMLGIAYRGMSDDVLVQIGLVVLVALAAKNAILIVQFAKQAEESGMSRFEAAAEAAKIRLRPILMTSFAFILGVTPLAVASGPGSEMRQGLGTAVFAGMIGVTLFGLIFTPVFYTVCRKLSRDRKPQATAET